MSPRGSPAGVTGDRVSGPEGLRRDRRPDRLEAGRARRV